MKTLQEWAQAVLENPQPLIFYPTGMTIDDQVRETVERKQNPLLTGHKIIVYRGYVASMQGRWMCVCGTLMASEVMGPELYKEFAAHEAEKLQEVRV